MTISRRGLLRGILVAGVAPAFVHNPMKIFVPKQEILLPNLSGRGQTSSLFMVDESGWIDDHDGRHPQANAFDYQRVMLERIQGMVRGMYRDSVYLAGAALPTHIHLNT